MDKEAQNILESQFDQLPKDIQDAILSVDLRDKLQKISKENHLHVDQAAALENEAVLVMLGLEKPLLFGENIKREVELSNELVQKIVASVNREIFLPIRESLRTMHEAKNREENIYEDGELPEGKSLSAETPRSQTEETTIPLKKEAPSHTPEEEVREELHPPSFTKEPALAKAKESVEEKPAEAEEIFKMKLQKRVVSPKEEISVSEEGRPKVKKPAVDPYREPVD